MKYYFGYNKFNGKVFAVKWSEDGGKPIGGMPAQIMQKVEITEKEFSRRSLAKLEAIYPYYPADGETAVKV